MSVYVGFAQNPQQGSATIMPSQASLVGFLLASRTEAGASDKASA